MILIPANRTEQELKAQIAINGFNYSSLGYGYFLYTLTSNTITQTGSNVTTPFTISLSHRLMRVETHLTNSSGSPDATGATLTFSRLNPQGHAVTEAATNGASGAADVIFVFGSGYEFNGGTYNLVSNATNTDLLEVSFVVQYPAEIIW